MAINIVAQQTDFDCGVAALATAVQRSYEDVLKKLGSQARQIGVTSNETSLYLFHLGHKTSYLMTSEAVALCDAYYDQRYNICHAEMVRHLCTRKQRAILTVKTPSGSLHAVYFDGNNILCPKRGVMGRSYFKRYTIFEAVLMHET